MPINPSSHSFDASVILTSYNQERVLPFVLQCLFDQDYAGRWEIIISDDGSSVETGTIVARYSQFSTIPIIYIRHARRGERRANTRNNGIRIARGKILIFLDGDIAVRRDFVAKHIHNHNSPRTLIYGSRWWLFLDDIERKSLIPEIIKALLNFDGDKSALHSDLRFQEMCAISAYPWLACMGHNMSLNHIPEAYFDENFSGWGCEDQEFAHRLTHHHNFKLVFSREIDTVHLDEGSRKAFLPVRPRTHEEILQYAFNLVRLCDLCPECDPAKICQPFGLFEYNHPNKIWTRALKPIFTVNYITKLITEARLQMQRSSSGPAISKK
jgi:glycosyltransferase involved in cell wall biosynthesis